MGGGGGRRERIGEKWEGRKEGYEDREEHAWIGRGLWWRKCSFRTCMIFRFIWRYEPLQENDRSLIHASLNGTERIWI